MGTLSFGRPWLFLVIMMGILFATPSLGQFQRNTASRSNIWRRQPADEPAPAYLQRNPASRNVFLPQSRPAEDPAASQSQPNPASGTLSRRQSPLPVELADDAAGDQLQPNTASRTLSRRQSPPDDDAAAAAPPPPPANAILPSASLAQSKLIGGSASARQGGGGGGGSPRNMDKGGMCHSCDRQPSSGGSTSPPVECMEETDMTKFPPEECHVDSGVGNNVRCISYLVKNSGPRKNQNKGAKDRMEKRRDGRGCMQSQTSQENVASCALKHLNLKLEDNKCIKGKYALDRMLNEFASCAGWSFYPSSDLKDTETTKPEPGKPASKDIADWGVFYGEYGRVQYIDLTICVCKGEKCNNKQSKNLGSTVEASGAERKLRTGILRLLT